MRILVINPGATSTKIAVYEEDTEVFSTSLSHAPEELSGLLRVVDQLSLREGLVRNALAEAGYTPARFDAVVSRGGLVRHIPSGTYEIDDQVIHDIYNPPFGEHASSLGPLIARSIAAEAQIPAYLVDPVSVDELQPLARVSGLSGMERVRWTRCSLSRASPAFLVWGGRAFFMRSIKRPLREKPQRISASRMKRSTSLSHT